MISVNCANCPNHCCGMNPGLTPVLLSSEEEYFRENSSSVKTPYREMRLLKKKIGGNCIFLDDKTRKCSIYENRPLEYRLFPFLLSFDMLGIVDVKLDSKNCSNISTLVSDKEKVLSFLKKYDFPKNWIKGYDYLTGV